MNMPAAEPTFATVPPGSMRYFLATRPAFPSVNLVAASIGLGTSQVNGTVFHFDTALVSVFTSIKAGKDLLQLSNQPARLKVPSSLPLLPLHFMDWRLPARSSAGVSHDA
jgi:hypothetical protein